MKYLLVLVVVWVAFYLWRHNRQQSVQAAARPAPRVMQPTVACAHCGLHVPQADAIAQGDRWFCSVAHAQAAAPVPGAAPNDGSRAP